MTFQIKTSSGILLAALLLCGTTFAQDQTHQSDDSVARIVQKQKARKARIVLTDDDLPHHPTPVSQIQPTRATVTPAPGAIDKTSSDKAPGISVPGLLVEGSVDDAKNLLDRLHQEEALLHQRFDQLQHDLETTDNAQLRHVYSDALSRREETLARTQKKIADTEKALAEASNGKKEGETNNAAK